MAEYCLTCRLNKKKIYFNIDRARESAKKIALEKKETQALCKDGESYSITGADRAIAEGFEIIEVVSKYL